jgi:hypothetical protein
MTEKNILVVARGFFEAFPDAVDEAMVRAALVDLGYPVLREVAPWLPPYLAALRERGAEERPAISSACPPANAWLAGHDPLLADCLVDFLSPAEEALLHAAREIPRDDVSTTTRLSFVSPCSAKKEAMLAFVAELKRGGEFPSIVFDVIDLPPLRRKVLHALGRDPGEAPRREEAPSLPPDLLFVEGEAGLASLSRGETRRGKVGVLPFWCEGGCNGNALSLDRVEAGKNVEA